MEESAKAESKREAIEADDQLLSMILDLVEAYSHGSESFDVALGRTPAQERLLRLSEATSVVLTVGLSLLKALPLDIASQAVGASLEAVAVVARRLAGHAIADHTDRPGELTEVTLLLRPVRHARRDLH